MPIVGDLKQVLTELNALVEPTTHEAWLEQIREWQAEYPMVIPESKNDVLHAQYVLSELNKIAKEDAIIVSDVGQHQMWAAQFLTHKKTSYYRYLWRCGYHGVWFAGGYWGSSRGA